MDLYASNNKLQTVIQEQVWEMLEIHWPALLVTGQRCQLMAEVTYHSWKNSNRVNAPVLEVYFITLFPKKTKKLEYRSQKNRTPPPTKLQKT